MLVDVLNKPRRECLHVRISELKLGSQAELLGVAASPGRSSRGERGEGQDGRNGSGGKLHCEDDCGDEVWKMEKVGEKVGVNCRRRCGCRCKSIKWLLKSLKKLELYECMGVWVCSSGCCDVLLCDDVSFQ